MEKKETSTNHQPSKIGHYQKNLKYPFFKNSGSQRRITRKRKDRAFLEIKKLIDAGVFSTSELASRLGRSRRQIRRYLVTMGSSGLVPLDTNTGRLIHKPINNKSNFRNIFAENPIIVKWIDDCIARQVKPLTIQRYVGSVRYMFNLIQANPKDVVSSKNSAIEFWTKFMVEYRKRNPTKGNQGYRTSFRNLLASHEIVFAPKMGKVYGLSASHDNFGSNAGVHFTSEIISEIGNLMLQAGDFRTYVWWRIGLRTGARNKAISKMVWERIYLDDFDKETGSFRLEQHETKDPRGQWFLGENGEWKMKYVPFEIRDLLLQWKKSQMGKSRFVWFADGDSDEQNKNNAKREAILTKIKFKAYYKKIYHKLDPRTKEYVNKRPTHILRHTLAQQMKNAGLTDEEIAVMFGWRSSNIVGTWYTMISDKKRKELGIRCSKIIF